MDNETNRILNRAKEYYSLGDLKNASRSLERLTSKGVKYIDKKMLVDIYRLSLDIASEKGEVRKSKALTKKIIRTNPMLKKSETYPNLISKIGIAYNNDQKPKKGITPFKKAIKLFAKLDNKDGIARCNGNIGQCYYLMKRFKKAGDFSSIALNYYRQIKDVKNIVLCSINFCRIFVGLKDFHKSKVIALDTLHLIENSSNSELKKAHSADIHNMLAVTLSSLSEYDQAIEHFKQSESLYSKYGDTNGEARAIGNRGITMRMVGNRNDGMELLRKAISMSTDKYDLDTFKAHL